ncbi:MAG TPA: glyceraldehyde 3-phosphate dehydrogenase NAD-binding domain-containing protein, partial [Daejeonella sp.]|nr:glyceraldehyde 3-phosphate dehydrogenase NAD-binding domain-containing protein [Daejeonella sp.]
MAFITILNTNYQLQTTKAFSMKKIAINGFGRIGRAALKIIMETPELEVVAINDLMSIENASYLLKYDSVYGKYREEVAVEDSYLRVGAKRISFISERDPGSLPWKDLNVDVVIESTGFFTKREDAEKHIHSGAKTVV